MSGTFGMNVSVTIAGESHGKAITAILSGISPGIDVDEEYISACLSRRRGEDDTSTKRRESDNFEVLSGVCDGKTTGTPITIVIPNSDTKSSDYEYLKNKARPGHADYSAFCKYLGYNCQEGGGHLSGRITAGLVAAGSIALAALNSKGIKVGCHIKSINNVNDREFSDYDSDINKLHGECFCVLDDASKENMKKLILSSSEEGNSLGGVAECAMTGLPAGLGDPFFDSTESLLSHMLFSIPAIKGVEFGEGFGFASMTGKEANDEFKAENGEIKTKTNHNGGINGGITNGMPVLFRCCVKPTPSISALQHTVDFKEKKECDIEIHGRHDPAIISRIPVIIESAAALVLCDLLERRYGENYFSPKAV